MKKRKHFCQPFFDYMKSNNIILCLIFIVFIGTSQIVYAGQILPHYDSGFNEVGYTMVPTDEVRSYYPYTVVDYTKISDNVYEITIEAPFPYEIRNLRVAGILPPNLSISAEEKYITVINALSADGYSFHTEDRDYDLRLEYQEASLSFLSEVGEALMYKIVPSVIVCTSAVLTSWPPLYFACEETVAHYDTIGTIVENGLESYYDLQTDEKIAQYLVDNNYYLHEIDTVEYVLKPITKHVLRVSLPTNVSFVNLMIDADLSLNQAYIARNSGSTAVYYSSGNSFDILNLSKQFSVTPSSGPNGSINPNSIATVNAGDSVSFTASPNAGYIVDRWYKNGVEIPGSEESLTFPLYDIQNDATILVTFKPTSASSQVYVAGSLNPSPISFSLAAGSSSGKFYDIPVQNRGSSTVSVNANLSGNAAAWATMTSSDSSFSLAPNETEISRVTVFAPANVSSGTYILNVSYNGTVQTFSIFVTVTGENHEEVLDNGPVTIGGPNWTVENVDIPSNKWNNVDDGFYDHIRLYAHVDSVSTGGTLSLYDAGFNFLMSNTGRGVTSSSVGTDIYWDIPIYRIEENDNTFGIAATAGTDLQLSNIRLAITFYTEPPDIKITKTLSSPTTTIGENITVTVTAENFAENSTTGFDVQLSDSLPPGLSLVSGSLNDNDFGDLEEEEARTNTYTIVANQSGHYTLPSAMLSYEAINGDDLADESIPVALLVTAGQLIVELDVEWPEDAISGNTAFNALVKEPDGVTPVLDASLHGVIQRDNGGTWETVYTVPMGWEEGNQNYTGLVATEFLSGGVYRAFAVAKKELYTDGQSSMEEWEAPQLVAVPNLVGKTQAQSESDILSASLTVGAITTANSDTVPKGNVISQNPLAGTTATINSSVSLVVSDGPSPAETPELSLTPTSLTVDSSSQSATFTVNNIGTGTMPWNALVQTGGAWLSITSGSSGTNAGTITVSILENTNNYQRVGTLYISPQNIAISPQTVTITQLEAGSIDTDGDGESDNSDTDDDNDGISDEVENGHPNGGDGNNDGIADSLQNNVTSIPSYGGGEYVTLVSPAGTSLSNCQAVSNPATDSAPDDIEFPYGLLDFTINGIAPGGSTTLMLYFPANATLETYYKYGRTPGDPTDHWYEFLYDGATGAEIDTANKVITLHFTDAEGGDDILSVDSMVVDLGGPGVASNTVSSGSNPNGGGGGGGGGCFITTSWY